MCGPLAGLGWLGRVVRFGGIKWVLLAVGTLVGGHSSVVMFVLEGGVRLTGAHGGHSWVVMSGLGRKRACGLQGLAVGTLGGGLSSRRAILAVGTLGGGHSWAIMFGLGRRRSVHRKRWPVVGRGG